MDEHNTHFNITKFLQSVALHGFTKACEIHSITRKVEKQLYFEVYDYDNTLITPYCTKQQIIYLYIAMKLKQHNL